MTTTIGRAVFTNAPSQLAWDGDTLTVNITINPSTLEQAKALRQQVLGLANNADEPVVPFTSTDDPDLDGFYVVEGVNVDPIRTYLASKLIRCGIGLRRVTAGYAKPLIEVSFAFAETSNPHGTAERARIGVPASGRELDTSTALSGIVFITTATGVLALPGTSTLPSTGVLTYQCDPGDYYDGAATIEYLVGGTWYVLTGKQVPQSATNWRISNGWLRMTPTEVTTGQWAMVFEGFASGVYNTIFTAERGFMSGGVTWTRENAGTSNPAGLTAPSANSLAFPVVLRNSPERVVIRVPQFRGFETWSLARGDAYVNAYWLTTTASTQKAISSRTAITVTDGGSHMVRAANDAAGFRYFVSTPYANTVDTVNSRIYLDVGRLDVAFSIGFSTPVTWTGNDEWLFALAGQAQSQRVSTR